MLLIFYVYLFFYQKSLYSDPQKAKEGEIEIQIIWVAGLYKLHIGT